MAFEKSNVCIVNSIIQSLDHRILFRYKVKTHKHTHTHTHIQTRTYVKLPPAYQRRIDIR
jgi:hypothetical protein